MGITENADRQIEKRTNSQIELFPAASLLPVRVAENKLRKCSPRVIDNPIANEATKNETRSHSLCRV